MPTARDVKNPKAPVVVRYDEAADQFVAAMEDYPDVCSEEGRGETRAQAVVRLEAKIRAHWDRVAASP